MNPLVIVGIPSWREADTIAQAVHQVDDGLARAYGPERCLIVNVDNESDDGTREVFLGTRTRCEKQYLSTGNSPRGKGKNLLRLFRLACELDASCLVTIDADVSTVTPEWPVHLVEPLLGRDVEFTVPIYTRNRFEGSTTNHFAFPILYGLLGANIRQPIGGEFGLTQRVARHLLKQESTPEVEQYGIDIFMTCHAVLGEFPVQEVFLGRKIHKPSFPKIAPMFSQVAAAAYGVLSRHRVQLTAGFRLPSIISISTGGIDAEHRPPPTEEVTELTRQATAEFFTQPLDDFPCIACMANCLRSALSRDPPVVEADIWAEFLARVTHYVISEPAASEHISAVVRVVTPVFLCRAATLWIKARKMEPAAVETEIQDQAEQVRQTFARLRKA